MFLVCKYQNWYTEKQYKQFNTFINPEIIDESEEMCTAWEGCISSNEELYLVERPMHIKVRFQSFEGVKDLTKQSKEPKYSDMYLRGMMCRIFQHEIDHLDGKLVWDKEVK